MSRGEPLGLGGALVVQPCRVEDSAAVCSCAWPCGEVVEHVGSVVADAVDLEPPSVGVLDRVDGERVEYFVEGDGSEDEVAAFGDVWFAVVAVPVHGPLLHVDCSSTRRMILSTT